MNNKRKQSISYKDAGVDIDRMNRLLEKIKPLGKSTAREGVLANPDGFAALLELPSTREIAQPVLLAATDGVGTKLRLSQTLQRFDTIGIDLVAMCVNDLLVHGGEPIAFLDYYACGTLDVEQAFAVIQGIAAGCKEAGAALVGGETAEMPMHYKEGDYELAGFAIGVADKSALLPAGVASGDVIIGIASTGIHSNGFSLVNRIIETQQVSLDQAFGDSTLGNALLAPTAIYIKPLIELIKVGTIHALAHITGGGLVDNLPRVLPDDCCAQIDCSAWQRGALFDWLAEQAQIDEQEMLKTFNCGIGMCVIADPQQSDDIIQHVASHGHRAFVIGEVQATQPGNAQIVFSHP